MGTEEETRKQIEQAHQEWINALDAIEYPIFLHDKEFRILRCNLAYQQQAGKPFKEIIGRPYYELFPKNNGPMRHCAEALEHPTDKGSEEEVQIDGRVFFSRGVIINDENGNYNYSLHILKDITEQRKIEQSLYESEEKFRSITESAQDAIIMMDEHGEVIYWNHAANTIFGYTSEEMLGKNLHQIIAPDRFREAHLNGFERFKQTGEGPVIGKTIELAALRKTGEEFPIELSLSISNIRNGWVAIGIIRDITDRKKNERLLEEERGFSNRLVETAPVIILILDTQGKIVRFNHYMEELSGYTLDEVQSKDWFDTFLPEVERKKTKKLFLNGINDVQTHGNITIILTKAGEERPIEWYDKTLKNTQGDVIGLLSIGLDITEQRLNEELLHESESKFRSLVESTSDWIWEVDKNGAYTYVSPRVKSLLGYEPQELLGKSAFDLMPPDEAKRISNEFNLLIENKKPVVALENANICKDGTVKILETSGVPYFNAKGEFSGYRGIDRDITGRKQSEISLNRANRALKTLSAVNTTLVRAKSEIGLLQTISEIITEQAGYSLAAVVYANNDPQKSIHLAAGSGIETSDYQWARDITWADTVQGQLPVSIAIRTGETQVCRNIACNIGYNLWKDSAISQGYISNIALPLINNDNVFGALCIYSKEESAFDNDEVRLLEELAEDLGYGIINLRTREEHEHQSALLRESLEQSVQTIAATVEARDPYTAGHQRRVAELATAIAGEMNLTEEQIRGIHFAAIIHDLGKIHIPAEILAKPGRLSEIEFMLIKTHPQEGYDILKDVKFPWPIAETILQHHEKLDGSGYPRGLRGDEIRLEARILTVADVVEAMYSHRPYRSALGIKPALDEIRRGRGAEYDSTVVDTCLQLFMEKNFRFSA